MKVGVIALLGVGMIIARPVLQNQAVTDFAMNGKGPVLAGKLFPFVFITVACGALSGFHALIASGTTPKMVGKESQIKMIRYGAMLMESFVAISALIAAGHRPGALLRHQQPGRCHRWPARRRFRVHPHHRLHDQPR
jgi:carbon starvation protein